MRGFFLLGLFFGSLCLASPGFSEEAPSVNVELQALLQRVEQNPQNIDLLLQAGSEFIASGDTGQAQQYFARIK